jgi:phage terminase large subunit-like protein
MTDTAPNPAAAISPARAEEFYRRIKAPPHPVVALPTAEQLGALLALPGGRETLQEILRKRAKTIQVMERNAFAYGYEPPMWRDADRLLDERGKRIVANIGGNRSTKSNWAAKRVMKKLHARPKRIAWCLSTTSKTSKRDQQPLLWHYLPAEWRALEGTKSKSTYLAYKQQTGFAEDSFVAPNGSQCFFLNYEQNRDVIEGGQVDIVWADEMMPADWLETLRSRIIDRGGEIILTFTPVRGFSATVSEFVTGATVVEWTPCDLLPHQVHWPKGRPGMVPYVLECLNPTEAVIFFQPRHNPFINYQALVDQWQPRGAAQILIRLHGVTQKTSGSAFPTFGAHNLIPHARIPEQGTNYHLIDFAWNRMWFMLWFRVCEFKGRRRIYCYREFPDRPTYGEWATMSEEPDGARGPAQETRGFSVNRYKEVILAAEGRQQKSDWTGGETILIRYGDARSGNAAAVTLEHGGTSFREMLASGERGLPPIEVQNVAAPDGRYLIEEGVNLFNAWLDYDEDQPLSAGNEPMFYLSDRCENTRDCLKIWSGAGGEKGAAKDPIDLCRYAAVMDLRDLPPAWFGSRGGGAY